MSHPVPSAFLDPSCRAGIPHLKALRTVAQAPPRLVQPCPSPSSPNPPTDPPRPGIDHHDGHSRLPRAWDDSEGFSATSTLASDTQATGVYSKYRCAGVQVRSRFRNLRGAAGDLSHG